MKQRIMSILFAVLFGLFAVGPVTVPVSAEETITVNAETVELYYLDSVYQDNLSIPVELKQNFQITVTGTTEIPTYKVISGSSAKVSSTGLIEPKATIWYKHGNYWSTASSGEADEETRIEYKAGTSVIQVKVGTITKQITVEVKDYAIKYADDVIAAKATEIAGACETDLEKFQAAVEYVADTYIYSASYSGYVGMIVCGGGDCWASTYLILELCEKMGVTAHIRYAANDAGAGSGHRNVAALCDGKVYIGEAGYSGEKLPRQFDVYEAKNGFSWSGTSTIYQYDGFDSNITVPEGVVTIGKTGKNVFNYGELYSKVPIHTIHLPSTVKTIVPFAFSGCKNLTAITVDENNPYFCSVDGVLYSKDMKTIVAYPAGKAGTEYIVPEGVEVIGNNCFYGAKLAVKLPSTLTTIKEGAFYSCTVDTLRIPASVTTIENFGLYSVKTVYVACANATLGEDVFQSKATVYCVEGSTVAAYLQNEGKTYETGTPEELMSESPLDISKAVITGVEASYTETGAAIAPVPVVTYNGAVLKPDVNYTVAYQNNTAVGTATITVTGIGYYTNQLVKTFEIVAPIQDYEEKEDAKKPLKKGTVFKDSKKLAKYKVISASAKKPTVAFYRPYKKTVKSITIPSTVTYNGIKYTVVEISSKAFYGCKKLTSVVIGKNVKKIGSKAFYDCKKLKTIKVKTTKLTKKKIGANAFKNIYKKAKIYVPKSKLKSYKSMFKSKGMPKKAIYKKL